MRSEYETQSRLRVNGDGGCYYERPRTNSEVDIMEWFASLDEDDREALLDMNEDTEADGCGPVRHDTNGAEGPREREDEIEYNSPPGQINGSSGGGSGGGSGDDDYDYCPYGDYVQYLDCYEDFIDAGYSQQDAAGHCAGICYDIPYPSDEDYDYSNICDLTCNLVCTSSYIVIGYGKCFGKCTGSTLGFGLKPCAVVCAGIATIGCWLGCGRIC